MLESVLSPGQHVGVHEDGEPVEPKHAFTGKHAQFQPKVIDEVYIHNSVIIRFS